MIPWPDFTAVPTSLIRADISPLALRLMLALAKFANGNRMAWPKHDKLLRLLPAGTTEAAMSRAKRELVEKGWLASKPGAGKGNSPGHKSCEYTLMMPEGGLTISRVDETVNPEWTKRSTQSGRNDQPEKELTRELTKELKNPAPRNGAAGQAQATQGVLLEAAVAVDTEVLDPVPPPRQAGRPHMAAGAPASLSPAAPVPPRRGHPAIATYYDRWRAHHGKAPTISPKRVGILNRIYKGLGPEAPVEYPRLLDALFGSHDNFIITNAHSPEVFETKLDALRVNGNGHARRGDAAPGTPLSGLGPHGEATMRNGLEWIRQTSGVGAGS